MAGRYGCCQHTHSQGFSCRLFVVGVSFSPETTTCHRHRQTSRQTRTELSSHRNLPEVEKVEELPLWNMSHQAGRQRLPQHRQACQGAQATSLSLSVGGTSMRETERQRERENSPTTEQGKFPASRRRVRVGNPR